MTLNFMDFYHYIDLVCVTGIGVAVGIVTGFAIARSKK